ncbi:MAG: DUF58 domain-containing protein [Verrucomicrobiota bacterium]
MPPTEPLADDLFPASFLQRLESLSLAARQLVRGRLKADRRSSTRGSSVEFAEYRPFTPGDDFRYIDWNAFARWRQLVLKLYVEEEDLYVHLLLDCTASMDWGEPVRKFDYARQAVAGLAYLALANLDRAAVVALGQPDAQRLPPARGRGRFLPLLAYLRTLLPTHEPRGLEESVRAWLNTKPQRGLVVVVSDLFGSDLDDAFNALDRLRYARHELAVLQLLDPAETAPGEPGEYEFLDTEYGERRKVIVDRAAAREFDDNFRAYQQKLQSYCKGKQIPVLQARTDGDINELLLKTLRTGGFVR